MSIKFYLLNTVFIIGVIIFTNFAQAENLLPRFVSLKADEVNARTGPNAKYPIRWVYIKKNEPVEIIAEFEQWRKIKDFQGDEGWVHQNLISGKRYVVIKANQNVNGLKSFDDKKIVFIAAPKVRAQLLKCRTQWCEIKVTEKLGEKLKNYSAWVEKSKLWGVYDKEEYN
jgi:SH3-like domain-containing protein